MTTRAKTYEMGLRYMVPAAGDFTNNLRPLLGDTPQQVKKDDRVWVKAVRSLRNDPSLDVADFLGGILERASWPFQVRAIVAALAPTDRWNPFWWYEAASSSLLGLGPGRTRFDPRLHLLDPKLEARLQLSHVALNLVEAYADSLLGWHIDTTSYALFTVTMLESDMEEVHAQADRVLEQLLGHMLFHEYLYSATFNTYEGALNGFCPIVEHILMSNLPQERKVVYDQLLWRQAKDPGDDDRHYVLSNINLACEMRGEDQCRAMRHIEGIVTGNGGANHYLYQSEVVRILDALSPEDHREERRSLLHYIFLDPAQSDEGWVSQSMKQIVLREFSDDTVLMKVIEEPQWKKQEPPIKDEYKQKQQALDAILATLR
jgi:hypothetical protein